jgi:hypothetical protein
VAAAVQACDELAGLLEELDQWVNDKLANLLEPPENIKRYRAAYLAQAREQLQASPVMSGPVTRQPTAPEPARTGWGPARQGPED